MTCRCGSSNHKRITHKTCPLNENNLKSSDVLAPKGKHIIVLGSRNSGKSFLIERFVTNKYGTDLDNNSDMIKSRKIPRSGEKFLTEFPSSILDRYNDFVSLVPGCGIDKAVYSILTLRKMNMFPHIIQLILSKIEFSHLDLLSDFIKYSYTLNMKGINTVGIIITYDPFIHNKQDIKFWTMFNRLVFNHPKILLLKMKADLIPNSFSTKALDKLLWRAESGLSFSTKALYQSGSVIHFMDECWGPSAPQSYEANLPSSFRHAF